MKKTISMLALVLSAWSVAGCAVGVEDVGEKQVVDEKVASAMSELNTSTAILSCPSGGTCARADMFCLQADNPDPSWCDILARCYDCGWPDAM